MDSNQELKNRVAQLENTVKALLDNKIINNKNGFGNTNGNKSNTNGNSSSSSLAQLETRLTKLQNSCSDRDDDIVRLNRELASAYNQSMQQKEATDNLKEILLEVVTNVENFSRNIATVESKFQSLHIEVNTLKSEGIAVKSNSEPTISSKEASSESILASLETRFLALEEKVEAIKASALKAEAEAKMAEERSPSSVRDLEAQLKNMKSEMGLIKKTVNDKQEAVAAKQEAAAASPVSPEKLKDGQESLEKKLTKLQKQFAVLKSEVFHARSATQLFDTDLIDTKANMAAMAASFNVEKEELEARLSGLESRGGSKKMDVFSSSGGKILPASQAKTNVNVERLDCKTSELEKKVDAIKTVVFKLLKDTEKETKKQQQHPGVVWVRPSSPTTTTTTTPQKTDGADLSNAERASQLFDGAGIWEALTSTSADTPAWPALIPLATPTTSTTATSSSTGGSPVNVRRSAASSSSSTTSTPPPPPPPPSLPGSSSAVVFPRVSRPPVAVTAVSSVPGGPSVHGVPGGARGPLVPSSVQQVLYQGYPIRMAGAGQPPGFLAFTAAPAGFTPPPGYTPPPPPPPGYTPPAGYSPSFLYAAAGGPQLPPTVSAVGFPTVPPGGGHFSGAVFPRAPIAYPGAAAALAPFMGAGAGAPLIDPYAAAAAMFTRSQTAAVAFPAVRPAKEKKQVQVQRPPFPVAALPPGSSVSAVQKPEVEVEDADDDSINVELHYQDPVTMQLIPTHPRVEPTDSTGHLFRFEMNISKRQSSKVSKHSAVVMNLARLFLQKKSDTDSDLLLLVLLGTKKKIKEAYGLIHNILIQP